VLPKENVLTVFSKIEEFLKSVNLTDWFDTYKISKKRKVCVGIEQNYPNKISILLSNNMDCIWISRKSRISDRDYLFCLDFYDNGKFRIKQENLKTHKRDWVTFEQFYEIAGFPINRVADILKFVFNWQSRGSN